MQDWIWIAKHDSPLISGRLWNFSVRVQSWSEKIESDPVLIRPSKTMHFQGVVYFVSRAGLSDHLTFFQKHFVVLW